MVYSVGIDPSLTGTGLSLVAFEGDTYRLLRTAKVNGEKDRGVPRLLKIENQLKEMISHEVPSIVLMEDYAYGGNRGFSIGEMGGVLKRRLHLDQIPYYTVAPSRWRLALFGRGTPPKDSGLEIKEWVLKELENHIRHEFDSIDEAEATALAILGTYVYRTQNGLSPQTLPKHLAKAIKEITS